MAGKQQKLLDEILLRKAVLKEYEKATDVLVAQLQQAMEQNGTMELMGTNGGTAKINSIASVLMPATPSEVLKYFDPRTLAALVAGTRINASKQSFLGRAFEGRNFGSILITTRDSRFTISLPRTKEDAKYMRNAIQSDMEEIEKKTAALLEAYNATDGQEILPDNLDVDAAMEKPKKPKKKAAKKRAKGKK